MEQNMDKENQNEKDGAEKETEVKNETEEVYIPANSVHMDDGLFDCLENVDFIQVANGNPAYYSEFGILYHADGRLACMPQARICK